MKLRIQNSRHSPRKVVLEPWANELTLAAGESIWVVAEGTIPVGAHFDVDDSSEAIAVTPEWASALAYFCDAQGKKLA